jgi:hypothetical protein
MTHKQNSQGIKLGDGEGSSLQLVPCLLRTSSNATTELFAECAVVA